MSYDVHLHIVGDSPEPIFAILRSDRPIDRLYLFSDDSSEHQDNLERIITSLEVVGINDVIDIPIDRTDYDGTFHLISSILEDEKRSHDDIMIHVNFSSGDAISVIAMRHAVESFDNDLYYVNNGRLLSMGKDSVSDIAALRIQTKVLETFRKFKDNDTISNKELMGDLSSPALSYRTKELGRLGLITRTGSSKNLSWKITAKGQQMLKRF